MTAAPRSHPRPPRLLDEAYADPQAVFALVERHAPYFSIQRYVANADELAAVSRERNADGSPPAIRIIPWFRGDWAYDTPLVEGVEPILHNPRFTEAAREVFGARIVRPQIVYVNLMAALPFAGEPHIDVPAFRGIDRVHHPVWLLHAMGRSGLFTRWQIDLATAVSWFYEGQGGAFDYWPEGTDAPPQRLENDLTNRAVVGDNDHMFHRVAAIGNQKTRLPQNMGLETELCPDPESKHGWLLRDQDQIHARYAADEVRISISWKAEVFRDEAAARIRDEKSDDLTLEEVIEHFCLDLTNRNIPHERPNRGQALSDRNFITKITAAYPLPEVQQS